MNRQSPIVSINDNEAFANSRDVAEFFGKRHAHVLRDIRDTLRPDLGSVDFCQMFKQVPYTDPTGRTLMSVDMNKDGFTLLVFGYTGKKAMQFKLRYVEEFNRMEAELKDQAPALPDFTNPAEAARAWAAEYEQKLAVT